MKIFKRNDNSSTGYFAKQIQFVCIMLFCLVLLLCAVPYGLEMANVKILGIPLGYFFAIVMGPLIALLIVKYSLLVCERIDLQNPDLENE